MHHNSANPTADGSSSASLRSEFPSYGDWLFGQTDEALADLLSRLLASNPTTFVENLTGSNAALDSLSAAVSTPGRSRHAELFADSPDPALLHLNSLELAVCHAACELDAVHHPCTVAELVDMLTELFDIAGTPDTQRPDEEEIRAAVQSLCHWGLVFGLDFALPHPDLPGAKTRLKIPPHLPRMFEPSTEQLWRLVDSTRCPIPTIELPQVVDELPPRQRRLLSTLAAGGGVGHSTSLHEGADPSKPLPTLVRRGILDQLDDTTARLTGRVQQLLRGTVIADPGGHFTAFTPSTATGSTVPTGSSTNSRADDAGAAQAIQLIQDLGHLIEDLGRNPIVPLSSGGIGTREVNKVARRRDEPAETTLHLLTWLAHANLIGRGRATPTPAGQPARDYWAPTELALDFLEASPATAWAILLLGWAGSAYAPWLVDEPDVRPFEAGTASHAAHGLRRTFPSLFADLDSLGNDAPTPQPAEIQRELWRVRPGEAWRTTHTAWDAVWEEAKEVGVLASLRRDTVPTRAMGALRDVLTGSTHPAENPVADLADALAEILPTPVEQLIVQADHTIMAPGLLRPADQAMLAKFSDQESGGMASVWRMSKESVERALRAGLGAAEVEAFLEARALGGAENVPQALRYMLHDAERSLSQATAGVAQMYLSVTEPEALDRILALPDIDGLRLRKIAPTVAVSAAQLSFVTDRLEAMGVQLRLEGGQAHADAPVLSRVATPPREGLRATLHSDPHSGADEDAGADSQVIASAIEGFRRSHDNADRADASTTGIGAGTVVGTGASQHGNTRVVHTAEEMMAAISRAYSAGTIVRISYVNNEGKQTSDQVSIVMIRPSTIAVVSEISGESFTVQPHRLSSVEY
ncbi:MULTISPECIES: helicase-associated domain-containing protein [unclassified Corynebacterium]|uniref:helicase-associated domain-containing protein n=1 Tax=unclassified Corynebacterium TaxID=2624378 RepID=UPI001EF58AEC|nr:MULTISPECIES: helicase-associated domain-containing protein [unclassified Corynebacterium]MCG7259151.1 helicase-associated domain-containing protein [Corynebacterium sp. ACRQK]MCG7263449.1 helicase-associated domain-containing protein [Corynebacterium sp. ACRQL]